MATYSYPDFVPQLYRLTQVPYDVHAIKTVCQSCGWQINIPEWADPDDETVILVHSPFWSVPFVAVFGEEQMSGLFLFARIDEFDEEDSYSGHGQAWFDARFTEVYTAMQAVLGEPNALGHYSASFDHNSYNYGVWTGTFSNLVLVQHQEGDANFGHEATLDIRLIPRSGSPLTFPLETDLIF